MAKGTNGSDYKVAISSLLLTVKGHLKLEFLSSNKYRCAPSLNEICEDVR